MSIHADTYIQNKINLLSDNREKVSVVLFVKNEEHDILFWLSWYHLLGFDTCIIYDDNSSDNTLSLIKRAANLQNIIFENIVGSPDDHFYQRQQRCYQHAISKYKEEFDWMAFFDSDEYLRIIDGDIISLINRFSHAEAIGFHWCNFGSNGHIIKPNCLPIEAYKKHTNRLNPINRHIKSIVRPKLIKSWINVHCFDVDSEKYFLPNGNKIIFSDKLGITLNEPEWSIAKILHFQCRSMEHFVERVKKMPQFISYRNLWEQLDTNEVEEENSESLIFIKTHIDMILR